MMHICCFHNTSVKLHCLCHKLFLIYTAKYSNTILCCCWCWRCFFQPWSGLTHSFTPGVSVNSEFTSFINTMYNIEKLLTSLVVVHTNFSQLHVGNPCSCLFLLAINNARLSTSPTPSLQCSTFVRFPSATGVRTTKIIKRLSTNASICNCQNILVNLYY